MKISWGVCGLSSTSHVAELGQPLSAQPLFPLFRVSHFNEQRRTSDCSSCELTPDLYLMLVSGRPRTRSGGGEEEEEKKEEEEEEEEEEKGKLKWTKEEEDKKRTGMSIVVSLLESSPVESSRSRSRMDEMSLLMSITTCAATAAAPLT